MTKVGGYGDEKPADDQTELIVGDASVREFRESLCFCVRSLTRAPAAGPRGRGRRRRRARREPRCELVLDAGGALLRAARTRVCTIDERPTVPSSSCPQVAGLNFRIKATVNDDKKVLITAFRALPHAGGGVEVKSVEVE